MADTTFDAREAILRGLIRAATKQREEQGMATAEKLGSRKTEAVIQNLQARGVGQAEGIQPGNGGGDVGTLLAGGGGVQSQPRATENPSRGRELIGSIIDAIAETRGIKTSEQRRAERAESKSTAELRTAQAEQARASAVKDLADASSKGEITDFERLRALNEIAGKESEADKPTKEAARKEMAKILNLPEEVAKQPGFFENMAKIMAQGGVFTNPLGAIAQGIVSVFKKPGAAAPATPGNPAPGAPAAGGGGGDVASQLAQAAARAGGAAGGGGKPTPQQAPAPQGRQVLETQSQQLLEIAKAELRKLNIPDTDANAAKLIENNPDVFGAQ